MGRVTTSHRVFPSCCVFLSFRHLWAFRSLGYWIIARFCDRFGLDIWRSCSSISPRLDQFRFPPASTAYRQAQLSGSSQPPGTCLLCACCFFVFCIMAALASVAWLFLLCHLPHSVLSHPGSWLHPPAPGLLVHSWASLKFFIWAE